MDRFPKEIVTEILSWLPVKQLLRCRCVSKPWCALIDSRHFVRLHLKMFKETRNNGNLVLSDSILYSVSMLSMHSLDVAVGNDDHPLKKNCSEHGPVLLGSCDGLVLLYNEAKDQLVIWNPSTRKYNKLPVITSKIFSKRTLFRACGIGYDAVHDDYKVVKIVPGYDCIPFPQVWVYSLKLNSWRRIRDIDYHMVQSSTVVYGNFASGSLHWIMSRTFQLQQSDSLIAAVDLATDEYRLVPMPNFDNCKDFHICLAVLEGNLCIMRQYLDQRVDVWVMKDYGIRDSWSKLLSVAIHFETMKPLAPLAFSKDGTKVLLVRHGNELIWFDINSKVVETVIVHGLPNFFDAVFCVPSLVPLGRGGESNGKKLGEETVNPKPKTIGKKRDGFLSERFKVRLLRQVGNEEEELY